MRFKVRLKYFTVRVIRIEIPWMETAEQGVCLRVNVQCTNFDWFIFNRQLVYHFSIRVGDFEGGRKQ